MRRWNALAAGLMAAAMTVACGAKAGSMQAASDALKASETQTIVYSGTGKWFQFGQAPNPTLPWPAFDVSAYTAAVDYDTSSAHIQMMRKQVVEPGRLRPAPVEQKPDQYVSGMAAWNVAGDMTQPAPAAVEERTMEVWSSSPQGFLKAAAANNATSQATATGSEVTFTANNHKYVGTINAQNQVEKVQTWINNPVLGDTLVETTFSDYRDFSGLQFPAHIVRVQGGYPVLDLTVSSVATNGNVNISVPENARNATMPAVNVTADKLADGVYYLRGGSHHSVIVDQTAGIVVIEGPQDEARSNAVIAKAKELIPGKSINYLVNTHAHFDHSGGVRTYVDEKATIVTHEMNRPYYEMAWRAPHTLAPDRLARSGNPAKFETFSDKHVLADANHPVEIYAIQGSGHNDAFAMVYLPKEKVLVEADAFTPAAADAPPPATANPFTVNLNDNITRLKLDVRQIAALHGPRIATMADLRTAIGQGTRATN